MVLVCIPTFLWVSVANVTHYHKVDLLSPTGLKRDFEITTVITAAILLAVAGGAVTVPSLI